MEKLHYILELADGRDMRLLSGNGAPIATRRLAPSASNASTIRVWDGTARAGSVPGYRLFHPGGTHLVGTLYPQLSWDGVAHDPSRPDFELTIPDHEAIASRLVTPEG